MYQSVSEKRVNAMIDRFETQYGPDWPDYLDEAERRQFDDYAAKAYAEQYGATIGRTYG